MKLKFFVKHGWNSHANLVTISPPSHIRFSVPFVKEHNMQGGESYFIATNEDEEKPQYLYIIRLTDNTPLTDLPPLDAAYKLVARTNSTTYLTAKQVLTALGITKTVRLPIEPYSNNGLTGFRVILWEKEKPKLPSTLKGLNKTTYQR